MTEENNGTTTENLLEKKMAGEKVLVQRKGQAPQIQSIFKVTKTQIILEDGMRYHRRNGLMYGYSERNTTSKIEVASDSEIERYEMEMQKEIARSTIARLLHSAELAEMKFVINYLNKSWKRKDGEEQ